MPDVRVHTFLGSIMGDSALMAHRWHTTRCDGAINRARVARAEAAWLPLLARRLRRGGRPRAARQGARVWARPPCHCAPAFPGLSCLRM